MDTAKENWRDESVRFDERAYGASDSANGGRGLLQVFRDQPLLVIGLGLALGATLGFSLPRSEIEDERMGNASDDLKDRAQEMASRAYERAKEPVEKAYHDLKDEVLSAEPDAQGAADALPRDESVHTGLGPHVESSPTSPLPTITDSELLGSTYESGHARP